MYVHLGGDLIARVHDIVAVLDIRLVAGAGINQEFVDKAAARKHRLGGGLTPDCKALVVARTDVIASPIFPATLASRMTHLPKAAMAWDSVAYGLWRVVCVVSSLQPRRILCSLCVR